jgi:uncharacterized protein (DUF1778 family)
VSDTDHGQMRLPRKRSESRKRTALVAVRLLPAEREALSAVAQSSGMSLSEFIRSSAMRTAALRRPVKSP